MSNHYLVVVLVSLLILLVNVSTSSAQRQVYIVYLGEHRHSGKQTWEEIEETHHSYLQAVKGSREEAKACIIYSYKNVINGFSALITPQEAATISANWDATRPPINQDQFLRRAGYGKDVIVGVLDSGVWPESQSFNDEGMEPVPSSWKGICESGVAFNSSHCNKKLIGARYYLKSYEANFGPLDPKLDFRSPRDINGHGTHTSSTIGGRRVPNAAAIGGFGYGTATGGSPLVRLAIYKVCWPIPDKHRHGIAIGSLHAVKRNIVVACSAGNSGPTPSTVTNVAPWIITVGASSIDRVFSSPVLLGNGIQVQGQSITPFKKGVSLVYAADVEIPGTTTNLTNGLCLSGTLSPPLVRGKAVFCWRGDTFQALEVQRAGGIATVLGNVFDGIG
ncbi:UNVERIFIED_CONTAM: Subtilisin-like protease SBT5.6 [Sesamum angustifolium]|uniref:Subtilisin-like protease SBT5.6 n=1 Tax=Sesamum angustifolium TaxID=2727405 RepID=A0AAW2PBF0_9LAMI